MDSGKLYKWDRHFFDVAYFPDRLLSRKIIAKRYFSVLKKVCILRRIWREFCLLKQLCLTESKITT